jgi:hypothetical protein
MDSFNLYFKILSVFLFVFLTSLFGQELSNKEKLLNQLNEKRILFSLKSDSLKRELDALLAKIELAKKEPGNDKINSLLVNAFNKTQTMDKILEIINKLDLEIKVTRNQLYHIYSHKMDSLEGLLKTKPVVAIKDKLEKELSDLNLKRIDVSPVINQFTFDPKLIEQIDLSAETDANEKFIFIDYLTHAKNEVDSNLNIITKKKEEVSDAIRLNQIADDFMDEAGRDIFFSMDVQVNENRENLPATDINNTYAEDVNSMNKINNVLQPFIYQGRQSSFFSIPDSVYSEEYLEFLEETQKILILYRRILETKLSE